MSGVALLFFPGDGLPITAGVLLAAFVGTVPGDTAGDLIGYAPALPPVSSRQNSRLFRPEHLDRVSAFSPGYGRTAMILARFVQVVRAVVPTLAGTEDAVILLGKS